MTRPFFWIFLLTVGVIAWPDLAISPPKLDVTLAAQQERVSEDPRNPAVWNDLGNLLVLARREPEAEEAYRQALALAPDDTAARFNLALLMQQTGRTPEAEAELGQLLTIDPYHGWAYYQLGMIFADRGDRKDALQHFAKALAYDTSLSFTENNPHIIDNPLFSEALLMSLRYAESPAARLPRQYGEPKRIVEMMLEEEAAEAAEGEEDGEDGKADGEGGTGDGRTGGGGARASLGDSTSPGTPRSATGTDSRERTAAPQGALRSVTVGQPPASSGAARPNQAGRRVVGSDTVPPQSQRNPRRLDPPRSGRRSAPPSASQGGETLRRSSPPPPPPPRSSRYIPPSRRSTSQLELRLLPEEESPVRSARLGPESTGG